MVDEDHLPLQSLGAVRALHQDLRERRRQSLADGVHLRDVPAARLRAMISRNSASIGADKGS